MSYRSGFVVTGTCQGSLLFDNSCFKVDGTGDDFC